MPFEADREKKQPEVSVAAIGVSSEQVAQEKTMIPYQEGSQGVVSVPLFSRDECEAIVKQVKDLSGWTAAQVREAKDSIDYQSVTRPEVRSAGILASDEVEELYRQFDARVNSSVKSLIREIWGIDLTSHSGTQFLRYGPSGHYVPHQDTGPGFEHRYFSVVCYLNDDFAGGKTAFPGLNYAVKPEAGKAIIFPSNYLHGSEPVVSGEKFVIVSWVKGPTPIKWI